MNTRNLIGAAFVGAITLSAGCNKPAEPPAAPPTQTGASPSPAQPASEPQAPPATPTAPMPPPNAPAGDATSGPKPGQVNDHSNPAFKKGGKEEAAK
jgi:hypothetical protein